MGAFDTGFAGVFCATGALTGAFFTAVSFVAAAVGFFADVAIAAAFFTVLDACGLGVVGVLVMVVVAVAFLTAPFVAAFEAGGLTGVGFDMAADFAGDGFVVVAAAGFFAGVTVLVGNFLGAEEATDPTVEGALEIEGRAGRDAGAFFTFFDTPPVAASFSAEQQERSRALALRKVAWRAGSLLSHVQKKHCSIMSALCRIGNSLLCSFYPRMYREHHTPSPGSCVARQLACPPRTYQLVSSWEQ